MIDKDTTAPVLKFISAWICFCRIPTSARSLNLFAKVDFPILFKLTNTVLLKTFSFNCISILAINFLSYAKINICVKALAI